MSNTRTQNAKKNIIAGGVNKTITLLLPFVLRTVMIQKVGVEYLGLNTLLSSILQVLSLSELGVGSAITVNMYKAIVQEDSDAICALLNFYKKTYRCIGIFFLGAGLLVLPFITYLISGSYPSDINIYLVYLIFLLNSSVSYFFFAYRAALLNAHQKSSVVSNVGTMVSGGMQLLQIVLLFLLQNYYLYILLLLVTTILNNVITAYYSKKYYPQYHCKGRIQPSILAKIKSQIAGLMIERLCFVSRNAFDSIAISMFLGLTISAIYGNYYSIIGALMATIVILATSIAPGIGNSVATESVAKNYADLKKFDFIYMLLSGWCTVCLFCLYQPFMTIWIGEEYLFSMDIVVLLCLYFYMREVGTFRGAYSNATGIWWESRYRAILEAVVNIILNFTLGYYFGVAGIVGATLISLVLINFLWGSRIVFDLYFKNNKWTEYFSLHLRYALTTASITLVTYLACTLVQGNIYLVFLVRGVLCVGIPAALYLLAYCKTPLARNSLTWLLKAVLKK